MADYLIDEDIKIIQPEVGFKASVDSIILAKSVLVKENSTLLDVGCGVGSASICAVKRAKNVKVTGIDIDENMAKLAVDNYANNAINAEVFCDSISNMPLKGQRFDYVITNPPFYERGKGRLSATKLQANHETIPLDEWIAFCIKRLKPNGTFSIIHVSDRLCEILAVLYSFKSFIGDITVTPISFKNGEDPKRVNVTARHSKLGKMKLKDTMYYTS